MVDYSKETTKKLRWLLWASLQDNLHRGDIVERCRDIDYKNSVLHEIAETEKTISVIRQELIKREKAFKPEEV